MTKICSKCGEEKPLDLFYRHKKSKDGRRPDCKECSNKQKQSYKEQKPYEYYLVSMSNGILKRIKHDVHKPKNKAYKEKEIKNFIGETSEEIREYLHRNFEKEIKSLIDRGIIPSVDRINSNKHYEEGNIRIVPLEDNVKAGSLAGGMTKAKKVIVTFPNNETKIYESVSECARQLNIDRRTVQRHIKNGTRTREGLTFKVE